MFVLASASIGRFNVLKDAGFTPTSVIHTNIDESVKKGEIPHIYALRIAREKMQSALKVIDNQCIITADTVVTTGRKVLPKAEVEADFRQCMELLSGKQHTVFTAVCVASPDKKIRARLVKTKLKIARLTKQDIEFLYTAGEWQGKAGGYAIQGVFGRYLMHLNGSFSNVIGLPVYETTQMLMAALRGEF